METRIVIAGSGGQGILFLGRIIAFAAMREGRNVTWFPSYGAEIRGGTANCTVIISDEMIGSPVVTRPDILITMNMASLDRFMSALRKGGRLFYDSSLIAKPELKRYIRGIPVPATEIGKSSGSITSANMAMLGAFTAASNFLKKESVLRVLREVPGRSPDAFAYRNTQSYLEGMNYFENTKS